MRSTGNVRVVLCGRDGPEAGRLLAFPSVVAAHRWVVPDSGYGVGDSFGTRSRRGPIAVADFL